MKLKLESYLLSVSFGFLGVINDNETLMNTQCERCQSIIVTDGGLKICGVGCWNYSVGTLLEGAKSDYCKNESSDTWHLLKIHTQKDSKIHMYFVGFQLFM